MRVSPTAATGVAVGSGATTFQIWSDYVSPFMDMILTLGGVVVLVLTIWRIVLEIRLKRRDLRDGS